MDYAGFAMGEDKAETMAKEIAGKMAKVKCVRGFYTGGTLTTKP
ncbi:MAG: hypothetical protein R2881_07465 [Eubacteriales bacterium]